MKKLAYAISTVIVLVGAYIGYLDVNSDKESASILRECGINPVSGEYYVSGK